MEIGDKIKKMVLVFFNMLILICFRVLLVIVALFLLLILGILILSLSKQLIYLFTFRVFRLSAVNRDGRDNR